MAITYNAPVSISSVQFYDASATTYSVRDTTSGDYFADDVAAADILYFGKSEAIWRDINVTVGTARNGTLAVVWEAYLESQWQDVTSAIVDDSDSFGTTGGHAIHTDVDRLWLWLATEVNGVTAFWLRCRVTSVSGVTEGGANATTAITVGNHTVLVDDETDVTFDGLYAADVASGWGAVKAAQSYITTHHMSLATSARISLVNGASLGACPTNPRFSLDVRPRMFLNSCHEQDLPALECGSGDAASAVGSGAGAGGAFGPFRARSGA